MKDKDLKLKLQFFGASIPGTDRRTDAGNYPEGQQTWGQAITLALLEKSWLIPGQTYTRARLSNAGTLIIPTVDSVTEGAVTELCEEGVTGTNKGGQEIVSISKKVTGKFDDCFTFAGIADKVYENALNTLEFKKMAATYNNYVYDEMIKVGTESAVEYVVGSEIDYFYKRVAEYKKENHMAPDYALVSTDFLTALGVEILSRETTLGDSALINGFAGKINGISIIERYDQVEDVVLASAEALMIAEPSSPKQIPNQGILGAYERGGQDASFFGGMVSLHDVNALAAVVNTYVHKFFGMGIISSRMITIPMAEIVVPGETPQGATMKQEMPQGDLVSYGMNDNQVSYYNTLNDANKEEYKELFEQMSLKGLETELITLNEIEEFISNN